MPKKRAELRIDKATPSGTGSVTLNGNGNAGSAFPGLGVLDARYTLLPTYTAHAADADAHHDQQHDITASAHHTTTANAGYVLGTSANQTLGMLATTADGAANHSTLLKSNASGGLTLDQLTAPALISANFTAPNPFTTGYSLHPYPEDSTKHRLQIGRIEADELIVKLFTADETLVRRGSDWLTSTFGIVARDEYNDVGEYTVPAEDGTVNIWFHDSPHTAGALFTNNEWVLLQFFERDAGITVTEIWGQVSNYTTDANHDEMQRWTFTNRTGSVSGYKIKPGMTFFGFGSSGDGWIYRTVLSGGPREKFVTWSGSNPRDGTNTLRVQVGDLTDVSGSNLSPSGYGLYASNAFLEGDLYAGGGDVVVTADGTNWKADTVESSTWTDYGNKISWMVDPLDPVEGEIVAQMWATRYTSASDTIGDWWLRVKAGGDSELTDAHIYLTAENQSYAALVAVNIDNNDPTVLISAGDSTGLTEYASINVGGRANEVVIQGDALSPEDDEGSDLGTATHRWGTIYVDTLDAGTEIIAGTLTGATWSDSDNQAMYIDNDYAAADSTVYIRNTESGREAHLNVEGNAVVGGNISVGGTVDGVDVADLSTDFSSHLTSGDHTALDVENNAEIGGTLDVTGAGTFDSTLDVTGALTASAAVTVGTTLGVTGAATFDDDANVGGALDVTGAATVGGALGVTGTITGSDTISGTSLLASTSFIGPILRPASDSTTALSLADSSGTAVLTIDTVNGRLALNGKHFAAHPNSTYGYTTLQLGYHVTAPTWTSTWGVALGPYANNGDNAQSVAVGALVAYQASSLTRTVAVGFNALRTSGADFVNVTAIGSDAGDGSTADYAIYIGKSQGVDNSTDGKLEIGSYEDYPVISGIMSASAIQSLTLHADTTVTGDIIASVIKPAADATDALQLTDSSGTAILTIDTINGDVDINGDLDITANSTVGGTLGVTGAGTFSSTLSVTGTLTASGAATVGTTLGVAGATTLSSTLAVTGAITASSTASIAGTVDTPQIDIKSGGTTYGRIDSTGITSVEPALTSGDNAQGWKVTWDGHLTAREVTAVTLSSFVFEMRQVHAIGSTLIVAPAGRLNADATMPTAIGGSSTFQLRNPDGEEGQIFQVDDVVRITALGYGSLSDSGAGAQALNPALFFYPSSVVNGAQGLATAWLTITSATAADGYWTYGYDLSDGATSFRFPAGTAVVKWGQDGDGLIRISSDDYDGYTPYLSVSTVTSTPWTGDVDIIRLGRIDGLGQITGGQQYGLAISTDWTDPTAPQFVASDVSGVYTKNLTQTWINDDGETAVYIDPDVGVNLRVFDNVVANSTLAWMEDASDSPSGLGSSSSNVLFGLSCNIDTDIDAARLGPYARMAVHGQDGDTESTLIFQTTTRYVEPNGVTNQRASARITMIADDDESSVAVNADTIRMNGDVEIIGTLTAEYPVLENPSFAGVDGGGLVFMLADLPTASTGLPTGAVWSDSGTLKVVE